MASLHASSKLVIDECINEPLGNRDYIQGPGGGCVCVESERINIADSVSLSYVTSTYFFQAVLQ